MWNEKIDTFEYMLLIAKGSCPILRKEVAKYFLMALVGIRVAWQWHWILLRRKTIWMLRRGLGRIIPALAFRR